MKVFDAHREKVVVSIVLFDSHIASAWKIEDKVYLRSIHISFSLQLFSVAFVFLVHEGILIFGSLSD